MISFCLNAFQCVCVCQLLSHVRLVATPWIVACQVSLSVRFSREEYWSGLPVPSPDFQHICIFKLQSIFSYVSVDCYSLNHIQFLNGPYEKSSG